MPRPRRLRKVVAPPAFKGYKPYGTDTDETIPVELYYEEYEAVKLADYDQLNQLEASKIMGISRPTFARIYASARQKISKAFVESREIIAVFGHTFIDKDWFYCRQCQSRFNIPPKADHQHCPLCNSEDILPEKHQTLNNENSN